MTRIAVNKKPLFIFLEQNCKIDNLLYLCSILTFADL